jgi:hypothetical protein
VGISYSGIGVLRNYDGSTTEIMPDRYPRILAGDPSRPWGFSFEPDVVVLNLGTNDFARGDPGQAYTDAYLAFVGQVRGHYPDAYLLLAVGSMLTGANRSAALADAQSVVASRVGAGDTRVGLVDLGVQSASDGYGCDSHPSVATDRKMADALVAAIHDAVGW